VLRLSGLVTWLTYSTHRCKTKNMRVVNDKQDPVEVKSVDLFALISQMFLVSVGVATWVFSPMVMVLSHCRFANPWSKAAGLGGAILALLFLEVPLAQVVLAFVVGLFVADGVERQVKPFQLISQTLAVAMLSALACLVWGAVVQGQALSHFWMNWVTTLVDRVQSGNALQKTVNWAALKDLILFEGPFLYLSATLMTLWISVGAAAHFGWIKEESNLYSSKSLKTFRVPRWVSLVFIVSFVGQLVVTSSYHYVAGGIFRVLSGFMFIQGSVCLALLLEQRKVRSGVRTLIYSMATVLGFYALVGMGIMSPWILRKKNRVSPQILRTNLEEQT